MSIQKQEDSTKSGIVRFRQWTARWLRPRGASAFVFSAFVLTLIVLVEGLVYETGGTGYAWLQLMYLPIILSASAFGVPGGVMAGLIGGVALGPFMPLDVSEHSFQTTSNWVFRMVFFVLVGAFSGLISSFLHGQIKRLQQTHQKLLQAHEELKGAQLKLIQTAKMESIGRISAGVAHEVKNPLAVIQLGVDYLNTTSKDSGNQDLIEMIQEMRDAVKRADTVIKGLLNFSRSEALSPAPADLNRVIEESLVLVRHEISKHQIALNKSLAEKLPEVALDQNKVKQVFINVMMNAIQEMGDKGSLSIETFVSSAANGRAADPAKGDSVTVLIKDTGGGIPEDKLDKLFEPFFTTKAVGSGTGLGLSVSRSIIEMHKGTMQLGNRTDTRGAVVTILFPIPNKEHKEQL